SQRSRRSVSHSGGTQGNVFLPVVRLFTSTNVQLVTPSILVPMQKRARTEKPRVRMDIRELNYLPDPQARALVSGRSHIIGLMVTEITNPFFPELIQRFEQFAVES